MKTFNEWLMESSMSELAKEWAPNGKYFTISPEWGGFEYWSLANPSAADLQMMADVLTSHGFLTKVANTGDQWINEERPNFYPPDELREKWDIAVDDAFDALKKYREVVGKKTSTAPHHNGGKTMPFYDEKIMQIWSSVKSVKDNPDLVKKIFDGLDNVTKHVLVHDAGLFNADGTLADNDMVRSY
jgi:hypothetical protein